MCSDNYNREGPTGLSSLQPDSRDELSVRVHFLHPQQSSGSDVAVEFRHVIEFLLEDKVWSQPVNLIFSLCEDKVKLLVSIRHFNQRAALWSFGLRICTHITTFQ